jgi:FecR-like protein
MNVKNIGFFTTFVSSTTALIFFLFLILSQGVSFASLKDKDEITRGAFIHMLAQNQPENSYLPGNHTSMSQQALFSKVAQSLKAQGINVLENKSADEQLTQQEFIRITYAFAGGPKNKTLLEQKLFLKNAQILSTADIGLTSGVDGTVYQKHKGQSEKFQAELAGSIFMDDQFETNDTSKALFTFDDRSTLTMSEDTVININKHVYNPDKDVRETLINASLGWVRFKVTKKLKNGSTFKVVTPTATAGVRGTEFVVKVDPGGRTTFLVLEGQIETRPTLPNGKTGRVSFISAGESQGFLANGVTTGVVKAPPGLIKLAQNKTTKPKNLASAKGIAKGLAKSAAKGVGKAIAKNNGNGKGNGNGVNKGLAKKSVVKINPGNGKGSAKNSAKFAAKGSAKSVAKGSAKNAAKNSAKLAAKSSAKSAAKDSAKSAAKDSAKSAAKDSAKSAAKDSAKSAAKDSAKSAAKDSAKSAAKDSAKSAAKDSAKSAAKDSAKSAAKDSAKQTAKDTARQNGKKKS